MQRILLVLAKAPEPGKVKTRLLSVLTPDACADLHARLVESTLSMLSGVRADGIELWCDPVATHPFFLQCAANHPLALQTQSAGDLGVRMSTAFGKKSDREACCVMVGTDCPPMTAAYVEQAFQALEGGSELVLGPAEDGGYVLIGLRRHLPWLFTDMPWSSDQVLDLTLQRARDRMIKVRELDRLWDLDRPQDLQRYIGRVERE